jgi:hypothetical protein
MSVERLCSFRLWVTVRDLRMCFLFRSHQTHPTGEFGSRLSLAVVYAVSNKCPHLGLSLQGKTPLLSAKVTTEGASHCIVCPACVPAYMQCVPLHSSHSLLFSLLQACNSFRPVVRRRMRRVVSVDAISALCGQDRRSANSPSYIPRPHHRRHCRGGRVIINV